MVIFMNNNGIILILFGTSGDILIVTHQAPLAAIQEFLLGPTKELLFPAQATVSKVPTPNLQLQ
jgi:hypothetical protein